MAIFKICLKCGMSKTLDEFYAHPRMADGYLGKCKQCAKQDVVRNYNAHHGRFCEYEQKRAKNPQRRLDRLENQRRHRANHPEKYKARNAVNNALRDDRLTKKPCPCGNPKSQAHHDDYSKPLDVSW